MLDALKRSSGFLFYALAIVMLIGILLVRRNISVDQIAPVLHVLDLPLLLAAMLYAGSSFILSIRSGSRARIVITILTILILGGLFAFLAYLNFEYPARAIIAV